jgi:predicted ATP-dependent protease
VDLEPDIPLTTSVLKRKFPAFLAKVCTQDSLLPLNRAAAALVAEYAVRLAGRTDKLTASLGTLADVLREADWCARGKGSRVVKGSDIQMAIEQSVARVNAVERRMNEAIVTGSIMIQTKGKRVGQINGLAVYDVGDYSFGRPSRITVETSVGHGGIINIEREAGMSGGSHDKGVHILTGYLRSRFAQKRPLSLTASICFEQSYAAIDGDSASSTEVYAILSSLSGLPIRQDVAVTGSVNQKGEIQAIGNVNEKIEGFYEVVQSGRPTGREGVLIPARNLPDLMLREDVVQAVKKGRFHIWPVRSVEEGIEILTGVKAGRRRKDDSWSPDSVFDRVDRRLEELVRGLKNYQTNASG